MEGFHFQFFCLPFGLSTSPRAFTKVLVVVIAWIRTKCVQIYHYLDDILVVATTRWQLMEHLEIVLYTLMEFGWLINQKKSALSPTQQLVYLGADIDMVSGSVALLPAQHFIRLIESMMAAIPMVKWAQWRARVFQYRFLRQCRTSLTRIFQSRGPGGGVLCGG